MSQNNLESLLKTVKSPADMLRNSQIGAYVYPVVPTEYGNWRDEQRAWRDTCVLFDQSHHMVEQSVEGPDAMKLLSDLAINSFKNFPVDMAKQFVPARAARTRVMVNLPFRDRVPQIVATDLGRIDQITRNLEAPWLR